MLEKIIVVILVGGFLVLSFFGLRLQSKTDNLDQTSTEEPEANAAEKNVSSKGKGAKKQR